uniref:Uncharacterized protein n=1 Tax=Bubo bubo TaxID=30461 RepID=A0A8C0FMC5_BUBBB
MAVKTSQFLHKSTGGKSPCKNTAATAALKIPSATGILCEISFCQMYDELLSNKVRLKHLVCMIPQCFKTHLAHYFLQIGGLMNIGEKHFKSREDV